MPLLTAEQYLTTFAESRPPVGLDEPPPFDSWAYFEAIPAEDFLGHDCSAGVVENAWRMSPGGFEHVLVNSENRNVYMVLVLDRESGVVYGHRLLDLNR